jgi:hypothetical protein
MFSLRPAETKEERKKEKKEEILNPLSHHLHQEKKQLALYFDV